MQVLIVDDQASTRTMLRHVVQGIQPSPEVADFGDPAAALDWTRRHHTDLVLLDYRMPVMDGLEFARRFRRPPAHRDVPIVVVTVVGDEPVRQAALDAGITDYITKPLNPRELQARCRNLLELRRQGESSKRRAAELQDEVQAHVRELEAREREILMRLARAVESRDPGTGNHVLRMSRYAGLIAHTMGLPGDQVKLVELAAPLHDIGKIAVPDAILLKSGPLTDLEWQIMQSHPQRGYEILSDSASRLVQMGAMVALHHHERWNGSGYPAGLAGEATPLAARIVALADVFDALTSVRPYKPAWSNADSFQYLEDHRGLLFDPHCVDALLSVPDLIAAIQSELRDPKL